MSKRQPSRWTVRAMPPTTESASSMVDGVAGLAQLVRRRQPGRAGADDDDVQVCCVGRGGGRVLFFSRLLGGQRSAPLSASTLSVRVEDQPRALEVIVRDEHQPAPRCPGRPLQLVHHELALHAEGPIARRPHHPHVVVRTGAVGQHRGEVGGLGRLHRRLVADPVDELGRLTAGVGELHETVLGHEPAHPWAELIGAIGDDVAGPGLVAQDLGHPPADVRSPMANGIDVVNPSTTASPRAQVPARLGARTA